MILFTLFWVVEHFGAWLSFWTLPTPAPWDLGFSVLILIAVAADIAAGAAAVAAYLDYRQGENSSPRRRP